MAGLLWSAAEETGVAASQYLSGRLAEQDLRYWARQSILRDSLSKLTRRLDELGIDAAVLKGIPAEDRWYDRQGERPSQDVDLLIAPHHLTEIDAVIETLHPNHVLAGHIQSLVATQRLPEIELWVEDVPVDLHFDLLGLGPFARHPGSAWEHLVPHDLGDGTSVMVLDTELSLINFVIHVNRDNFRRLLGLTDVAKILQRSSLNWGIVDRFVRSEGIEAMFYESLAIVVEELGLRGVPNTQARSWQSNVHRRIWRPAIRLLGDEARIKFRRRQYVQPFLVRRGIPAALRWWTRRLLPPRPLMDYYQGAVSRSFGGYLRSVTVDRMRARRRRVSGTGETPRERSSDREV